VVDGKTTVFVMNSVPTLVIASVVNSVLVSGTVLVNVVSVVDVRTS